MECSSSEANMYIPWDIKRKLDLLIDQKIKQGEISDGAYYVRFLNGWETFWYHEDSRFIPASLLKIPIAIALLHKYSYKDLDKIHILLDHDLFTYQRSIGNDTIKTWNRYSLLQLLKEMLENSDNAASNLLIDHIWEDKVKEVYKDLWIGEVDFSSSEWTEITVKRYAAFLRILFNASYISRENSEFTLQVLTDSNFITWIRAKLPINQVVANKFWERILENWETQLHDCGIIYIPERPYLLCIMTRGKSFELQTLLIQQISYLLYEDVLSKSF